VGRVGQVGRVSREVLQPTIQYVPEGDPDKQNPGALSVPSPAFDMLLDAAARSLAVRGSPTSCSSATAAAIRLA
jgi:hypothetical protein